MRIAEANLKPKILSEVFFVFPTAQGERKVPPSLGVCKKYLAGKVLLAKSVYGF